MEILKISVSTSIENFWNAVKIYIERPNSVNKQVLFSERIFGVEIKNSLNQLDCFNLVNKLSSALANENNLFDTMENYQNLEFNNIEVNNSSFNFKEFGNFCLLLRKLVPKPQSFSSSDFFEFIFLRKSDNKIYIYARHVNKIILDKISVLSEKSVPDPLIITKFEQIKLSYNKNTLELSYPSNLGQKGVNWLESIFINKFKKLMLNNNVESNKKKIQFSQQVNVVKYYELYEKMKTKYAKFLIENWTENTDPKKFVFEDIGIATYLMLLWNQGDIPNEESKRQRFFDLGCGNGLLVHILNSEGHIGVGLDVRKRKIWDFYDSSTVLKEEAVIPTIDTAYPEADWLIGNHSDELTAWIPIMARRSNSHCQFFVLPCCPYQLNGKKFQRKNSGVSSYEDFIEYVKEISELCEFETYMDKLRIPSTKRICIVGYNTTKLSENKFNSINEKIINLVIQECMNSDNPELSSPLNFQVRNSTEKVKNCTKLPKNLVDKILTEVTNVLLKEKCVFYVMKENQRYGWNRGGQLLISELAKNISEELLKQLKAESKGLQTLLKNHHFIFDVSRRCVQFRNPENLLKISQQFMSKNDKSKWKQKTCWFYNNHPDKCPLLDGVCSFSHDNNEK